MGNSLRECLVWYEKMIIPVLSAFHGNENSYL